MCGVCGMATIVLEHVLFVLNWCVCGVCGRATIVLEHVLFVLKCFIANMLPEDVFEAKLVWQVAEDSKAEQLSKWNIVENEIEDPTPF